MPRNYDEYANEISKIIDIAIKSIKQHPPKVFREKDLEQFMKVYLQYKDEVLNPEPRFKNVASLNSVKNDILTMFQETSGEGVNNFWKAIKNQGIDIKRENKLKNILRKGKISNQIEFDFAVDTLVPYLDEGIIGPDEAKKIDSLIYEYENK